MRLHFHLSGGNNYIPIKIIDAIISRMFESGETIKRLITEGKIKVEPTPEINETAIKINLSGKFGEDKQTLRQIDEYILPPLGFILGVSQQTITLPKDYLALFDGYAGTSAMGLFTHLGSMLVQPGFSGQLTIEMFNASKKPITLRKGMRVGNLLISKINTD